MTCLDLLHCLIVWCLDQAIRDYCSLYALIITVNSQVKKD